MTPTTTQQRVRAGLSEVDFPADKDQLVAAADRTGADDHTLRALRSMPPVRYTNIDEVLASVETEGGPRQ